MYFARVADSDRIETASNYVRLHTGKTTHRLRQPRSALETRLQVSRGDRDRIARQPGQTL